MCYRDWPGNLASRRAGHQLRGHGAVDSCGLLHSASSRVGKLAPVFHGGALAPRGRAHGLATGQVPQWAPSRPSQSHPPARLAADRTKATTRAFLISSNSADDGRRSCRDGHDDLRSCVRFAVTFAVRSAVAKPPTAAMYRLNDDGQVREPTRHQRVLLTMAMQHRCPVALAVHAPLLLIWRHRL